MNLFNLFLSYGNAGRNKKSWGRVTLDYKDSWWLGCVATRNGIWERDQNQSSLLLIVRIPSRCITTLLPCLPVISIIFSSITCFRRQFLCKMWPIQIGFLPLIVCRIFVSTWTLCSTSSFFTHMFNWSPSFSSTTFQISPKYFWLTLWSVPVLAMYKAVLQM